MPPRNPLGTKGRSFIDMSSMGVPIPPGFVLNVSVCEDYFKNSRSLPMKYPASSGRAFFSLKV